MPSSNWFVSGTGSPSALPQFVAVIASEIARPAELAHELASCHCCLRSVTCAEAMAPDESLSGCAAALVPLAVQAKRQAEGLAAIRGFRQRGVPVIAFADGVGAWPLGMRCQALLAGAVRLLDSAQADFSQVLCCQLSRLLDAAARREAAQIALKDEMARLGVVAESPAMLAVAERVKRVGALSDLPVLLTGETGTGKEVIARALHQLDGKRRTGAFIALNCSALNPNLAESELFGHKRGAFTGAERDRRGLFRAAQGGMLFLDEIGELDLTLQAKLLRVLQENRVLGVGEEQETPINVRVIAATNRDLSAMMAAGKFRSDLFYRLNLIEIHLPPLRERPEDLEALTRHFLQKYGTTTGALGADFLIALALMDWPGNVRQLENLLRFIIVNKNDDDALCLNDFPQEVWEQLAQQETTPQPATDAAPLVAGLALSQLLDRPNGSLAQSLDSCEKFLLESALQRAHGNQTQAAKMLGLTPRSVYNKIRKHQLDG